MKKQLAYLFVIATSACAQQQIVYTNLPNYDLNNPLKYAMPADLREISGIDFYKGDNNILYAEQDEEGKLFWLKPGDKTAHHIDFGKHGDYEDVALTYNLAILLRSDGTLFSFPFNGTNTTIEKAKEWKNILPSGEYEGLFADAANSRLYALCKNCTIDKNNKTTSGYTLQINNKDSIFLSGTFTIETKQIAEKTGKKKIAFRPSALAKNVRTNEWYILSSVNKMLVVTDQNFQVKAVYPLNPKLFVQPEGIAFDGNHNLYISNEIANSTSGTVYKFPYRN